MRRAIVVGGSSGIGLAVTLDLLKREYNYIYIFDRKEPNISQLSDSQKANFKDKTRFQRVNLINEEYSVFDDISDIDTLIITAGFGRVALFEELLDAEISALVKCNELAVIRIIKKYYNRIKSKNNFYCVVMGSIAGHVASPFFSVYSAAKSGLCRFVEAINSELAAEGYKNRILDVSPGSLEGTSFNGGETSLELIESTAHEIIDKMINREDLYIPLYKEVYREILNRYHNDAARYGIESYEYKRQSGRISTKPQLTIGYLSGTFDLFHIGHLNLLRRAKENCDYLIVGVHKSGAWKSKETFISFEERIKIVESICYVDKAVESFVEDIDAYPVYKYNKLFVGSDYKGTERFNVYENYFQDKGVEIVYFPYTTSTSSTQLRNIISNHMEKGEV